MNLFTRYSYKIRYRLRAYTRGQEAVDHFRARMGSNATNATVDRLSLFSSPLRVFVCLALSTELLFKIPFFFHYYVEESIFYQRYLAIIIFNSLILYSFCASLYVRLRELVTYVLLLGVVIGYVSLFPREPSPYTRLSTFVAPLLMCTIWGWMYTHFSVLNGYRGTHFIRLGVQVVFRTLLYVGMLFMVVYVLGDLLLRERVPAFSYYSRDIFRSNAVILPLLALYHSRSYARTRPLRIRLPVKALFLVLAFVCTCAAALEVFFDLNWLRLDFLNELSLLVFFGGGCLVAVIVHLFGERDVARYGWMVLIVALCLLALSVYALNLCASALRYHSAIPSPYLWGLCLGNALLVGHLSLIAYQFFGGIHRGGFRIQKVVSSYFFLYVLAIIGFAGYVLVASRFI